MNFAEPSLLWLALAPPGAAVAVLTAIHRAGGWHVVDPIHQDRMRAALDALESAVEATLNERGGR